MEASISGSHRFKDKNVVLWDFQDIILVKCPVCQKRAEVRNNFSTHQSRFYCPNCHHQYTSEHRRLAFKLNVYCNNCANHIRIYQLSVQSRKEAIRVKCKACGDVQTYKPTYTEHIMYGNGKPGKDPFMGLDLWLQHSFKRYLFWAYNYKHLNYLENYTVAKLRERNNSKHMTMVEKLPLFIKSAKNREDLLRLIEKLKSI